jgi:hypothetical protein
MNTEIALLIGQALVKYGPTMARALAALFMKDEPTLEDWEKVFALAEKPYEAYTAPSPGVS